MFLPQCERLSFVPIQNVRHNYSFVYFNRYIFIPNWRQKILHRKVASIPRLQSALNFFKNWTFIFYGCSQIFELFHFSKDSLPIFILWFCPAFWLRDMTMYLVFSAFTSRQSP
jgi:hypothetical protein